MVFSRSFTPVPVMQINCILLQSYLWVRDLEWATVAGVRDVVWLYPTGREMEESGWHQNEAGIRDMRLNIEGDEVLLWFNRTHRQMISKNPLPATGARWVGGNFFSV